MGDGGSALVELGGIQLEQIGDGKGVGRVSSPMQSGLAISELYRRACRPGEIELLLFTSALHADKDLHVEHNLLKSWRK
jgi:hypothetical protein